MAVAGTSSATAASAVQLAGILIPLLFSWLDEIPTRHACVLVWGHVAVVEPAARVVLGPAGGHRLVRPDGRAVDDVACGALPAVAVDVPGVKRRVASVHVERDVRAHLRPHGRGVARARAPVEALDEALDAGDLRRQA